MPPDLNGLADIVVLTVKNAMAPAMERIALLEKDNADLRSQLTVVGELRDRVVVAETKAALLVTPPVELPEPVDLAPLTERMALLEQTTADVTAKLAVVTDLRDRVVTVETKAAMPVAAPELPERVDLSPVLERLAVTEKACADVTAQLAVVTELRDRVVVVETKAAIPAPVTPVVAKPEPVDVTPMIERVSTAVVTVESGLTWLKERVTSLENKSTIPQPSGLTLPDVDARIVEKMTPVQSLVADARERLAAVEVRQPIPGAPGKDGKDGAPGKDGVDGFAFDDLMVVQQDDRSFTVKAMKGDRAKDIGTVRFPAMLQRGVYVEGKMYEPGDVVTWAGSQFHCNEATTTKPETSKAWTLIVKRGRDGKDGRDALDPVPVVRAGAR